MDILAFLAPLALGLHMLLWVAALVALLPFLVQPHRLGRAAYWLVAILALGGLGVLTESAFMALGFAGRGATVVPDWLARLHDHPAALAVIHSLGMAAAAAVIALVASGRLARDAAVFTETEAALKAAEAGYRAVFEGAVDGIYRMTPGGRFVHVNPACAKILGYAAPADCLAAIAPSGGAYVRPERQGELIAAIVRDGAVYRFESELRRRDGSTIWVSESMRAVTDDQGRTLFLEGMMQEVTDRRRAREELKLAAAVFDAAGDGILVTDENDVIRAANPAFIEATGYALEELIGRDPKLLDDGHHDRAFFLAMRRSLETNGQWRGEVWLRHKSGGSQRTDLSIVAVRAADGRIVRHVAVYGDRARNQPVEERGRNHAHYDALTGLANRWLFQSRLGQALTRALRDGQQVAALAIDIDHFKFVNDSLGHAAGDLLVQEMARRLLGTLRKQDIVARIGGDEFGIIVPEVTDPAELTEMGERIVAAMAEPFRMDGEEIFVTASVGIAIGPRDGEGAEELMRNADTAMFHAKDQGRNNLQFYTDRLNTRAVERLKIENNLRRAIERSEFVLHYQPQIDIASRRIIGAEALIRWNQPEEGMIPPGRFIPVAEETGMIMQIGDWALREACRQIQAWEVDGLAPPRVSVNLSFKQFRKPDFLDSVERAIQESGVDPHRLEFELTESMVMHDVDNTIQVLKRIKSLGIEVSIDDFGTGYSSLSHIKRLPIDTIKIDRSFVKEVTSNVEDAEIATAIVALAHSLNLKVIAEGVETAEQLGFLSSRHCDAFQGFLVSPAIPADAFLLFQADWNDRAERTSA